MLVRVVCVGSRSSSSLISFFVISTISSKPVSRRDFVNVSISNGVIEAWRLSFKGDSAFTIASVSTSSDKSSRYFGSDRRNCGKHGVVGSRDRTSLFPSGVARSQRFSIEKVAISIYRAQQNRSANAFLLER